MIVSKAMHDAPGARVQADMSGYELVFSFFWPNWQPLFTHWYRPEAGMREMTEQKLWAEICVMLDQWKWCVEAEDLLKKDLANAWRDMEVWDRESLTPGRWMDGSER
jgi:hypothetical protein